jgi:hypothetical protein
VLLIGAIGIGAIAMIVFGAIKSSDVYRGALADAEKDPRVIAALGAPIHAGFLVTGNVSVKNQRGTADIQFPLIGSKARGLVHAVATRDADKWQYTELTVTVPNGPSIDLLRP